MKIRNLFFLFLAVMLISGTSHANMKKGSIGNKGQKVYSFTNNLDGPCTASLIYDSTTADLDTGFAVADTGDLLCFSFSSQRNFDTCTTTLPPGDFQVIVSSYKGSSAYRVVVNCGGQENVNSAGQKVVGTELREVEQNTNTQRLQDQIDRIQSAVKK